MKNLTLTLLLMCGLYSFAQTKAQAIAGLTGQKIGKITEVTELGKSTGDFNLKDIYYKILEGNTLTTGEDGNVYGEIGKTITVKFATE